MRFRSTRVEALPGDQFIELGGLAVDDLVHGTIKIQAVQE
jgi:hypothetical protein